VERQAFPHIRRPSRKRELILAINSSETIQRSSTNADIAVVGLSSSSWRPSNGGRRLHEARRISSRPGESERDQVLGEKGLRVLALYQSRSIWSTSSGDPKKPVQRSMKQSLSARKRSGCRKVHSLGRTACARCRSVSLMDRCWCERTRPTCRLPKRTCPATIESPSNGGLVRSGVETLNPVSRHFV